MEQPLIHVMTSGLCIFTHNPDLCFYIVSLLNSDTIHVVTGFKQGKTALIDLRYPLWNAKRVY